jgi:two-component SAPR family response regulator
MPKINDMEASTEIRVVNPHQEIIFASAYVKETLEDSFEQLNQIVELLQKPFTRDTLIDTMKTKKFVLNCKNPMQRLMMLKLPILRWSN